MTEFAETLPRRKPGPARTLTREQILQTGLEVMAADGLRAVSFRTISMRLGVDRKALYTYLQNKDDLLNGMFDLALAALDMPRPDDQRPPEVQLVEMFVSLRRALIANAGLLQLTRPTKVDVDVGPFERVWSAVARLEPDEARAGVLYTNLVQFTLGSALYWIRTAADKDQIEKALAAARGPDATPLQVFGRAILAVDLEASFVKLLRVIIASGSGG